MKYILKYCQLVKTVKTLKKTFQVALISRFLTIMSPYACNNVSIKQIYIY